MERIWGINHRMVEYSLPSLQYRTPLSSVASPIGLPISALIAGQSSVYGSSYRTGIAGINSLTY